MPRILAVILGLCCAGLACLAQSDWSAKAYWKQPCVGCSDSERMARVLWGPHHQEVWLKDIDPILSTRLGAHQRNLVVPSGTVAKIKLAQVPLTGAGLGAPAVVASYTGPANVVASPVVFWGFRCVTSTYNGNVADIWDGATGSTTETLITCDGAGKLVTTSPTAIATTCAVSCRVKILYNQTGGTACADSSGNCDMSQTTNANRPAFTSNCQGGRPCMACVSGTSYLVTANNGPVGSLTAQPITVSMVSERTGNTTNYNDVISDSTNQIQIGYTNSSNQIFEYAGSIATVSSINDNAWHAVQNILNGASSVIYVDGGSNTVSAGTSVFSDNPFYLCGATNTTTGNVAELGIWDSGFSAGNQSAMNTNQHSSTSGYNF